MLETSSWASLRSTPRCSSMATIVASSAPAFICSTIKASAFSLGSSRFFSSATNASVVPSSDTELELHARLGAPGIHWNWSECGIRIRLHRRRGTRRQDNRGAVGRACAHAHDRSRARRWRRRPRPPVRSGRGQLGVESFELDDHDRAVYHAAAAFASSFLVTVHEVAAELIESAGAPAEALEPLMQRTIENGFRHTGPLVRGDWQTVERHREAIRSRRPQLLPLYEALTDATATLLKVR